MYVHSFIMLRAVMRDKRNAIRVVLFQFGKVCCDPYLMALQVARKAFKSCLTFHSKPSL